MTNSITVVLEKAFYQTSIHYFKYTIIWSELETPQTILIETSKQIIYFNTGCVTNATFWEVDSNCGTSKKASEIALTNFEAILVQEVLQWKAVKNSLKLKPPSLLKGQGCRNEILDSSVSL